MASQSPALLIFSEISINEACMYWVSLQNTAQDCFLLPKGRINSLRPRSLTLRMLTTLISFHPEQMVLQKFMMWFKFVVFWQCWCWADHSTSAERCHWHPVFFRMVTRTLLFPVSFQCIVASVARGEGWPKCSSISYFYHWNKTPDKSNVRNEGWVCLTRDTTVHHGGEVLVPGGWVTLNLWGEKWRHKCWGSACFLIYLQRAPQSRQ